MIDKIKPFSDDIVIREKINEIIDVLNQYEEDGVWTRKEFQERLKKQLYNDYMKNIK